MKQFDPDKLEADYGQNGAGWVREKFGYLLGFELEDHADQSTPGVADRLSIEVDTEPEDESDASDESDEEYAGVVLPGEDR